MPVAATTRAKVGPYLRSLSRMRNRGRSSNGVASRSCWATQASVGWRVTPTCTTRRDPSATTTKAWSGRKSRSVTGRKSQAQVSVAWLRRKVAHVWPARRGGRAPRMPLDRGLGHANAQLQQLAPDALGTPEAIRRGELLDQRDRLGCHLRLRLRLRLRFPPPEQAEALPMPAQQGLRLDDQQGLAPGPKTTGQQHQERPVGRGAARALDAAPQDDDLLAQERVLGDEGGPTAHEVGECARHGGLLGGLRRRDQSLPKRVGQGTSELGTTAEQARQHQGLLIAYRRRQRAT